MERKLTRIQTRIYHYVNGKRVDGVHDRICGDVTGIRGNVFGSLDGKPSVALPRAICEAYIYWRTNMQENKV